MACQRHHSPRGAADLTLRLGPTAPRFSAIAGIPQPGVGAHYQYRTAHTVVGLAEGLHALFGQDAALGEDVDDRIDDCFNLGVADKGVDLRIAGHDGASRSDQPLGGDLEIGHPAVYIVERVQRQAVGQIRPDCLAEFL